METSSWPTEVQPGGPAGHDGTGHNKTIAAAGLTSPRRLISLGQMKPVRQTKTDSMVEWRHERRTMEEGREAGMEGMETRDGSP